MTDAGMPMPALVLRMPMPSYGILHVQVAPPGAETTMTTLAFVIFDGLGCSIGGSVSGILYKTSKILICRISVFQTQSKQCRQNTLFIIFLKIWIQVTWPA
jgi:hypothetical protein